MGIWQPFHVWTMERLLNTRKRTFKSDTKKYFLKILHIGNIILLGGDKMWS